MQDTFQTLDSNSQKLPLYSPSRNQNVTPRY
jgi:hypothetical protein